MRIVIEAPEEIAELIQVRQVIDALLHSLMYRESERMPAVRDTGSLPQLWEFLPVRTANALAANNILTLGALLACSAADLMRLPGFGRRSMEEVTGALSTIGRHLQPDNQEWQR